MIWDSLLVAATVSELTERLDGARVRSLHFDRNARRAALYLREGTLLFDLHPVSGAIALLDPAEPPESALPLAALVRAVAAPPDERLLTLDLTRLRGRARRVQLVVELIPGAWNAILTEGSDGRIRSVLRRRSSAERPLHPGVKYRRPRPSNRKGRKEPLSLEAWTAILGETPPGDRPSVLVRSIAYTSKLNAPAFLGAAAEGDEGAALALEAGWQRWTEWRELRDPAPCLLETPSGAQPYPYPVPGVDGRPATSVLEGMGVVPVGDDPRAALLPSELMQALEDRIRHAEGKLAKLREELDHVGDPAATRALGDMLLARMAEVPRGASSVSLDDFEGRKTRISLDPTLAPHENAARYYDRAARAQRAQASLPALIDEAGEELDRLYALEESAREGRIDANALRERVGRSRPQGGSRGKEVAPRLPYHRFRSSAGTEIRVGRNARANDDLTFHHSDPDDVWLHARHGAGAHVVLRWSGEGSPAKRDLQEAATLAAVNSKGRTSGSVPVDWTRRKYVRKPRKSPPGTVVVDRAKTVFVSPDEGLVERLRWEDGA